MAVSHALSMASSIVSVHLLGLQFGRRKLMGEQQQPSLILCISEVALVFACSWERVMWPHPYVPSKAFIQYTPARSVTHHEKKIHFSEKYIQTAL